MSIVKEHNYESPEAILRGLIVRGFIKADTFPSKGCYCRGCRLVRRAYKVAGVTVKNREAF